MTKVAIIDDYQNVALKMADWDSLEAEVEVFTDHLEDEDDVAARLLPYDVVVVNRERTPFPDSLLGKLSNLKLLITNGMYNNSIDIAAAHTRGITVCGSPSLGHPTPELTWGLIISLARNIPLEERNVREGRWQTTVGLSLKGRTLGIIGLGRLGTPVAQVGLAFGMEVLAWSPNLTDERAAEAGVTRADKDELLAKSDFITLHMPLSDRSRGIMGAEDFAKMKPTAFLINTSRGPLVDEAALIEALNSGGIGGAGLDVYDHEPLPADHPIRSMPNTVLTPHLGYVTVENYEAYYPKAVESIIGWQKGAPTGVLAPK